MENSQPSNFFIGSDSVTPNGVVDGHVDFLIQQIQSLSQENAYLRQSLHQTRQDYLALQTSETIYRTLLENSSDCICYLDLEGNFRYMSPGGLRANNLTSLGQVYGKHCTHNLHPTFRPAMLAALERARQGLSTHLQYAAIDANGQETWWDGVVDGIKDSQDVVIGLLRSSRNITTQRQLEKNLALHRLNLQLATKAEEQTALLKQANLELKAILDNSPALIYLRDPSGKFLRTNRQFDELLGLSGEPEQIQSWQATLPPELMDLWWQHDRQVLATADALTFEDVILVSGQLRTFLAVKFPLVDETGSPYAVCSIATDISDRKQLERDLYQSQQFLNSLVDNLPLAIFAKDVNRDFQCVLWNKAAENLYGRSRQEVLGVKPCGWLDEATLNQFRAEDLAILEAGKPIFIEEEAHPSGDKTIQQRVIKVPLYDEEGHPTYIVGIAEDITDRKQAEEALHQSEILNQALLRAIPDLLIRQRRDGVYLDFVHGGGVRILTGEDGGLIGTNVYDVLPQDEADQQMSYVHRALETGQIQIFEHKLEVNGEQCWEELRIVPSGDHDVLIMVRNISDRKQAEARLQEQEQFLRSIYDGVSHPIFVVDVLEDGEFQYLSHNQIATNRTGISSLEVAGKAPEDLFGQVEGSKIRQMFNRCVTANTTLTQEECLTFQGKIKWGLTTCTPLCDQEGRIHRIVGTAFDISELKQAQEALQQKASELENTLQELRWTQVRMVQSEKMSSLGQLVAGVAHEINNPINFIYGNLAPAQDYVKDLLDLISLYQTEIPNTPALQARIEDIDLDFLQEDLPKILVSMKIGADRIRDIVRSLRTFSRLDEAEMKAVDIHEGIESTLMILQPRLKAKSDRVEIHVIKQYGNLPLVECYAGQLNQVFMNILSNAIDSLEEHSTPQPTITIQTELVDQLAVIHMIDNGMGMTEAVRQRLFDPFFTTKAIGKGTGLGMSISYQIVTERHQGKLDCFSSPGKGAEFIIEIPLQQHQLTQKIPSRTT